MNNLIASNHALRLDVICELPDDLLLDRVRELAARERLSTAELVAHLAEVDLRRLYLGCGCSSMFTYCTELLHLSESAAYSRIEVARTVRRFPQLLPRLADGSLSLTTIRRLGPLLTSENCERLVLVARYRTARQIDELIARERPKPDAPAKMRRLPRRIERVSKRVPDETSTTRDGGLFASANSSPALDRASIQPLAPERHRVQFTASGEMRERIERLQALLRHRIPDGDLAEVIDMALIELITKLEARKCGAVSARGAKLGAGAPAAPAALAALAAPAASEAPSTMAAPPERTIPQAVRRAVCRRDGGRCAFFSAEGKRCSATEFLEFHHLEPFARGGGTTAANLELRCRPHNAYEAETAGLGRRGG